MASDSIMEFEDMDMTELDADTLMKLLEDEPAAGGEEKDDGGVQPPGWTEESDGSSRKKAEEEEEIAGDELEWLLGMTEMCPAPPCAVEVGGEMLDMGEYGLDYYCYYNNNNNYYYCNNNNNNAAFLVEETGFEEGLW